MRLFEKPFKRNFRKFVNKKYKLISPRLETHTSSLEGITHSVYKIIYQFADKKKYLNNDNTSFDLDGYHIDSKNIKMLKRNKIYIILNEIGIELFQKSPNSTYHVSNSKALQNGYTHWYRFSDELKEIIRQTEQELLIDIKNNKKLSNLHEKYIHQLKALEVNKLDDLECNDIEYLKLEKNVLYNEYELSNYSKSKYLDKIMRKVFYWDDDYIYIDNITKDIQNFRDMIISRNKLVFEIFKDESNL